MTDDVYSRIDISRIAKKYLLLNPDLFRHVVESYPLTTKWITLVQLGAQCNQQNIVELSKEVLGVQKLMVTTEQSVICAAFEEHRNSENWLQAIASNTATPTSILSQLERVRGVKNAVKIRRASRETMQIKKMCGYT